MRKTPRGWIQIGEFRTRGVARIPLGLKPSRDSRATSQRDSPIWIKPLGVFRYTSYHDLIAHMLRHSNTVIASVMFCVVYPVKYSHGSQYTMGYCGYLPMNLPLSFWHQMFIGGKDYQILLTHWGRDKWTPFRRRHFQLHFPEWKCLNSD